MARGPRAAKRPSPRNAPTLQVNLWPIATYCGRSVALSFSVGSGPSKIYEYDNRSTLLPEKRVALERWATFVGGLVSGRKANVTLQRLS